MEGGAFPPACPPRRANSGRTPFSIICDVFQLSQKSSTKGTDLSQWGNPGFPLGSHTMSPRRNGMGRSTHRPGNTSSKSQVGDTSKQRGSSLGGQSQTVPVGVVSVQCLLPNPHLSNFLGEFLTTIGETACIVWEQSIAFRPNAFLSPLLVGQEEKVRPKDAIFTLGEVFQPVLLQADIVPKKLVHAGHIAGHPRPAGDGAIGHGLGNLLPGAKLFL